MYINLPSGVSTYVRDVADLEGCEISISLDGIPTKFDVSYCGEFAVYYVNSHGGWDSFLFEGKCTRVDEIERHSIEKSFRNTSPDFERNTYMSELNVKYTFSTGWLTDEQSAVFAHELIQSNMIYAHDLVNDRIFPIVIENDTAEFKRWKDNRKIVSHTLNVVESQSRIRR